MSKVNQGPSIFVASNDAQAIAYVNSESGNSFTTINEALDWVNNQNDYLVQNRDYEGIVTDGLVFSVDAGFAPSYPGSGTTWNNLSGNGNNGTLINGPTFNSGDGGSIAFDGVNDRVNFPHISSYNLSTLTALVWIKPTSPYTGTFRNIISKQGADRDWNFYLYSSAGNGVVNRYHFSTARASAYTSTASIPGGSLTLDVWHQCGFSVSNGVLKYYLDGNVIASNSINFSSANSSYPISIGGADNYTKGNITTSQVYNRGLSDQEVLKNYNATKGRFGL